MPNKAFFCIAIGASMIVNCHAANNFEVTDTITMSLDQCIAIALDQSPTIKIAEMEIERMDYSKKEVIGQFLPSVNFGANYSRTLAKQVAYMNMSGFPGLGGGSSAPESSDEQPESRASGGSSSGRTGIKMGLDNSYSVGFSAAMPLIAPQLWKSLKLSDSQILQSVENSRKSKLALVNQVENAYYGLLLAVDSKKVIQESYDNAKLTNSIYEKQYQVGTASEYDVLRTSVAVKNIEPQLLQADIAIKQARLQLAILMGLDAVHAISPANALKEYENTMYDAAININRSIEGNSDLRLLDIQTTMLNQALDVQKMSLMPTLVLSGNYNWTASNNSTPFKDLIWNPYSMIGLSLDIPLFTGGQRYNRIRQAKVQVNEMKWQRDNLVRSINMQVDLAVDNINVNVKQIASNAESVNQAEKAHTIMERSFQIGAASYLDLRDSELALTQARLAYYQSIYNYLVARSDLKHLLGQESF